MSNNRRKPHMLRRIDKVLSSLDALDQQLEDFKLTCQMDKLFGKGPIEELETTLPIETEFELDYAEHYARAA